jgi:hypothetical protein
MAAKRAVSTASTSPRQIAIAERRALVLTLRRQGRTVDAVAAHIGNVSAATCYRDTVEAIAAITAEPAKELVTSSCSASMSCSPRSTTTPSPATSAPSTPVSPSWTGAGGCSGFTISPASARQATSRT